MKKLLIHIIPLFLLMYVGCGGEEDVPPTLPAGATADATDMSKLYGSAQAFKGACGASMGPTFLPAAQGVASGNKAGAAAMPAPSGDCNNSFENFLMSFVTMQLTNKDGQRELYANTPEGKQWMTGQVAGLINNVARYLQANGVQLTPAVMQQVQVIAVNYAQKNFVPGVPQNYQGQVAAGLNQYGGVAGATSGGTLLGSSTTGSLLGATSTGSLLGSSTASTLGSNLGTSLGSSSSVSGASSSGSLLGSSTGYGFAARGIASTPPEKAPGYYRGFVPVP